MPVGDGQDGNMSIRSHFVRLLGLTRREPATHENVEVAAPPPEAIPKLLEAQAKGARLYKEMREVEKSARVVQQQLASGALRIVADRSD